MLVNVLTLIVVSYVVKPSSCAEKAASCLNMQDVVIKRSLTKQGFHRDMITTIHWSSENNCTVMLKDSLPCGIYVDIDQVNMMNHEYKIRSGSRVDIEAPAHKAEAQALWVYLSPWQHNTSRKGHHTVSISLPIHMRYHRPCVTGKTHETVSLGSPRILAKCDGMKVDEDKDCKVSHMPCSDTESKTCEWVELPHTPCETISVEVPVGPQHHGVAVTLITLLCTMAGTGWTLSQILH